MIFEFVSMFYWWFCSFGRNEVKRSKVTLTTKPNIPKRRRHSQWLRIWVLS